MGTGDDRKAGGRLRVLYVISAVVVWVIILFSAGVLMAGNDNLNLLLAILSVGALWFVVVVPSMVFRSL